MERKRTILLSLLLCATLILAACGGGASPTSGGSNGGATSASQSTSQNQSSNNRPQTAAGASSGNTTAESAADSANTRPSASADAYASASAAASAASGAAALEEAQSTASTPPSTFDEEALPTAGDEEPYDSTYYQNYGVNPFVDTATDALSTFAMDIDTASYGVMRRYLSDGNLPNPDSVRVEEYVNAFDYQYPEPDPGSNFAISTEGAPSPFGGPAYEMVQIGIQGRTIADEDRAPTSLTFVIDVSGSMEREDRLQAVKQALTLLVEQLRPDDQVGIVVYGDTARQVLPPTSGRNTGLILDAIGELQPSGSTNVEAGLDIGFQQANEAFVRGSNMILLCSDGVANNGVTDPQALLEKYDQYTSKGIKLATFGFGMGNYNRCRYR